MINWRIETHESVTSTQDIAHIHSRDGAPEGCVIMARAQTSGRGRHGRAWEGGQGNLYASLILRPKCPPADAGQIALLIGLSLHQALSAYIPVEDLRLKWPNDLLVRGRKIAGILLETPEISTKSVEAVIVGFGVNIFEAPLEGATSLSMHCNQPPKADDFLQFCLTAIAKNYKKWQQTGFHAIREPWLAAGFAPGAPMMIKNGTIQLSGLYDGLDERGNLQMRLSDGTTQIIRAGEVFLETGAAYVARS